MSNDTPRLHGLYPMRANGIGFKAIFTAPLTDEQVYQLAAKLTGAMPLVSVEYVDRKTLAIVSPYVGGDESEAVAAVVTRLKQILKPELALSGLVGLFDSPFGYFEVEIAICDWCNERERMLELGDVLSDAAGVQPLIRVSPEDTVGIRVNGTILSGRTRDLDKLDYGSIKQILELLEVRGSVAATVIRVDFAHRREREAARRRFN